ncbi:hypothetical protein HK097_002722 [Rhizophlyctis rosea]|uniref:Uncharacterized protein n=1 Tax=Rhizophlyctis rosea TaxID=64517 RepID=A0AAD5S362_9FUNG|nr:hypothetical protein HK097_002722 [Rhizophlyctis rosea]
MALHPEILDTTNPQPGHFLHLNLFIADSNLASTLMGFLRVGRVLAFLADLADLEVVFRFLPRGLVEGLGSLEEEEEEEEES